MKLLKTKILKLIKESITKNIGEAMSRQYIKYLIDYKDKVKFTIKDTNVRIEIRMLFEDKPIGFISANYRNKNDCNDSYVIGLSEIKGAGWYAGGEDYEGIDYKNVPPLFRDESGYGPILYELMLEYVSIEKGKDLTQDREEVSDPAFNTWDYYLDDSNRPDVEKKQLDFSGPADAPWKLTPQTIDDCDEEASMFHYDNREGLDPWHQGPEAEYVEYVLTRDPLMKSYSKSDNPFFKLLNSLNMIQFI